MWTTDTELAPRLTVRAAPKRLSLSGDEHLARLIRRRNEAAFAALYQRYHQRLYRYCRSMLHNDADAQDALQSTFTGAFSALAQGRRDAPMRPWLYRIAYNESISVMRRRRPDVALTEAHEASGASTEELVAERARLSLLVADLRELTERQRGALVMRELSGLSHEEIATVFDISVGAAKQTIFEARRSLAEFAEGRAMACDEVCRAVSDGNGRVLRGRKLRAHLRECGSCAAFAVAIPSRSSDLRAIAPPLSAVAAAGLLQRSLAASSGHGAGGGGAAATGSGAATASGGAGSGAASAGGVGSGAAGSAVGSGSATVAAGAVSKVAGLAVAAKTAVGVAVVATAAAGVAGAVNHFDSSPSRGVASARALRQSGHSAGSAGHSSASAGAGRTPPPRRPPARAVPPAEPLPATGPTSTVPRTPTAQAASANAGAQGHGNAGAQGHGNSGASAGGTTPVHGKPPGATKTPGAANGGAGAKSPGAGHGHSGSSNGHSSSSGHAASSGHSGSNGHSSSSSGHSSSHGGQSGQSSSTSAGKSHGSSTSTSSTTSSPSTTTAPPATHGTHGHAGGSSSGGSASSSQPASGGSSAPGNSHSK